MRRETSPAMSPRAVFLVLVASGVAALLVRCGGSTAANPPADAGTADGAQAGADDGGGDAADAPGDGNGFGDTQPCSPDAAYPPDVGTPFACGAYTCYSGSEYCLSATGGPKRGDPIIGCRPFLECGPGCTGTAPSCGCTAYGTTGACKCTVDAGAFFLDCSFP